MNDLTEEIRGDIEALLSRTNDEFGLTLSGNPISPAIIEEMQKAIVNAKAAKENLAEGGESQVDQQLGMKRIAY